MTTGMLTGTCVVVAVAAWLLTGVMRRYALRRQLVDVPGRRSSHVVPTPRGGGAAIVLTVTFAFLVMLVTGDAPTVPLGVIGAGLVVALVGFVDDHRSLPAVLRLGAHVGAAVLAVVSLGGAPPVTVLGTVHDLGIGGDLLACILVVWLLNLTNFMDGIDGIVGVQVATVCVVGASLAHAVAPGRGMWAEPLVLTAATLGFLMWNWPPARIFMGDVGSGYIGFFFGVFSLRAGMVAPELLWAWIVLSGVFVVDATVTLLTRLHKRERVMDAHRSHAYQHLTVAWNSHRRVTCLVLAINVIWLAPIAWLVATGGVDGLVGVGVAYAPLVVAAVRIGAGHARPKAAVLG